MSKFTKSFLFPVIIVNLLITAYILFFQEGLFFNDIYNPNGIKIEIFGSNIISISLYIINLIFIPVYLFSTLKNSKNKPNKILENEKKVEEVEKKVEENAKNKSNSKFDPWSRIHDFLEIILFLGMGFITSYILAFNYINIPLGMRSLPIKEAWLLMSIIVWIFLFLFIPLIIALFDLIFRRGRFTQTFSKSIRIIFWFICWAIPAIYLGEIDNEYFRENHKPGTKGAEYLGTTLLIIFYLKVIRKIKNKKLKIKRLFNQIVKAVYNFKGSAKNFNKVNTKLSNIIKTKNANKEKEDSIKEVKQLKELLDSGILTQEEFDKKAAELKKIILGN